MYQESYPQGEHVGVQGWVEMEQGWMGYGVD